MLALLAITACGKPAPIIGEWKMDDLDNLTMTFQTDGKFLSLDNGRPDAGSYHIDYDGTTLETTFNGQSYHHRIAWIDANTFQTTTATNKRSLTMTWRRLPNDVSEHATVQNIIF